MRMGFAYDWSREITLAILNIIAGNNGSFCDFIKKVWFIKKMPK